jgi:lipid II:glycine glycyltransferase (peptidoglycan interpeptide bridge formation enzyme)
MEKTTLYVNSVFEQPWWLDIVANGKWHEVIVEENGKVVARMPYVFYKKWWGRTIEMPRLTQTSGPWIKECEIKRGNENLSYQKELIFKLLEQIPKCKYFKIRIDSARTYVMPFIWKGYSVKSLFSYRIQDLSNVDKIYENFNRTVKKNIKSAEKKVMINENVDVNILLNLLEKTFNAQGRHSPISKDLIRDVVSISEKNNSGKMFTAIDDKGNVHACSYFVFDKNVFYYLISGSDKKFRSSGAQTLILWEAIKYASTVSRTFDFEGSMIEGIEKFFRQFGGTPVCYYEVKKIPIIFEICDMLKPRIKKIIRYK